MPSRIQRKRTRGWRKPPGCVDVTRNSRWGNPHVVGRDGTAEECVAKFARLMNPYRHQGATSDLKHLMISTTNIEDIVSSLEGRDIMCWCGLCEKHQDGLPYGVHCPDCPPCHGNWLLNVANDPQLRRTFTPSPQPSDSQTSLSPMGQRSPE